MKLYGSSNNKSFNTLKLRFALAEIGAAHEFVPVDLGKGESRTPDFLRINPHGKVPVLVDGDFALPESGAILWYLGEKYPDAKLLPRADGTAAALQARAQILRFSDIASTALYPAYSEWWNATSSDDPGKRSPAVADAALAKVTRALGVLEKALAAGDHLVGSFSLADVANASILFSLKRRLPADPLAGHERARAWYARVIARPTWQTVTAD
ncbi:MAG TPA: glutathione S-transferase family protein [Polyangia bacterium]|jgi:glutathione S-transferase